MRGSGGEQVNYLSQVPTAMDMRIVSRDHSQGGCFETRELFNFVHDIE